MKKEWSFEEDQYIKLYYPTDTNKNIADALNVSTTLISKRAKELGLKKVNTSKVTVIDGIEVKYCRKCEKYLPIEMFSINRHKPSGYNCWCKFHMNELRASKNLKKMLKGNE